MKTYETSDFQLAVTLTTLGYKLSSIDSSLPRSIFHFDHKQGLSEAVNAFYSGDLKLNPQLLLTYSKIVKDRLHGSFSK